MKNNLQDYTEIEFFELLNKGFDGELGLKESDDLVEFLNRSKYPKGAMIIINPSSVGIEDDPKAIVEELKRWYSENDLPCFKE